MACALVNLSSGKKYLLYHLNIPSWQALSMLLFKVESAFCMSLNEHLSVGFSGLLNIVLANTLKNLAASSLVIVLFGRKVSIVLYIVSHESYIHVIAV